MTRKKQVQVLGWGILGALFGMACGELVVILQHLPG